MYVVSVPDMEGLAHCCAVVEMGNISICKYTKQELKDAVYEDPWLVEDNITGSSIKEVAKRFIDKVIEEMGTDTQVICHTLTKDTLVTSLLKAAGFKILCTFTSKTSRNELHMWSYIRK